jgi:hypothetical protein
VSLDLTELPFAPVDSSSEGIIEEIENDESETISFTLEALANAEPGIYKIPVLISYENTSKTALISIEVKADASLELLLESTDLQLVNEQGKVAIKVVNTGLTQIKVLKVTLEESYGYEILSPSSVYIGDVDIGDFETEEFSILPLTENPVLKFTLEYTDANNKAFTEKLSLPVTVYTQEQATALGLIQESHPLSMLLILIVVILAVALFVRRRRKRKNAY